MRIQTLAFDVYGTLIDTMGVVKALEKRYGNYAPKLAREWRNKQLEYTFRRALMKDYMPFSVCTREALEYLDAVHCVTAGNKQALDVKEIEDLMQVYSSLPPFAEVKETIKMVKSSGYKCWAFSNGETDVVTKLLKQAGIWDSFTGLVSVDEVRSFKPEQKVYEHFCKKSHSKSEECILISSNPFDILGAMNSNWRAIWLNRDEQRPFEIWRSISNDGKNNIKTFIPNHTISHLNQLTDWLKAENPKY